MNIHKDFKVNDNSLTLYVRDGDTVAGHGGSVSNGNWRHLVPSGRWVAVPSVRGREGHACLRVRETSSLMASR